MVVVGLAGRVAGACAVVHVAVISQGGLVT
jgi:hypothetical protein